MQQKLNRILRIDSSGNPMTEPITENVITGIMIIKVVAKPNPFLTAVTLDVTCAQSKHVIVRMFDGEEKIVKMFSWFLVKGINVTTINDINGLYAGAYTLDIIDLDGDVLYSARLQKS